MKKLNIKSFWRTPTRGKFKNYDISKKLRKENKSSDEFEIMLSNLTLEEVIALKLHLASKTIGGKFYGFPLWYSTEEIVRDALLKYAYSCAKTKREAGMFLGVYGYKMINLLWKYKTLDYFSILRKKNVDKPKKINDNNID